MILNLETKNKQEELIKAYLEENASQELADKINNGTPFEKDGKPLTNKKTMAGFMKYACEEAKKISEQGEISTCIVDSTIYGWAIHYFEEDSIEGTLYTFDGAEYKPEQKKVKTESKPITISKPLPKKENQYSIFEIDNTEDEEAEDITEEIEPEKTKEQEKPKGNPIYQKYMEMQNKYPDCIIAYRLGDFYEIFGENAVKVADELGLTLTGRDCGLEERVPMVGFPYHVADMYIGKLVNKGYKVAMAETMNDIRTLATENHIDEDTEEMLTEEEMQEFDGDIEEPSDIYEEERDMAKHFDNDVLRVLVGLFENNFKVE